MKLVSRQLDLVATSFLFVFDVATARCCRNLLFCAIVVATTRCCRDLKSSQLMSRQPGVVATSFLWNYCRDNQVFSQPLFFTTAVATTRCCRNLFSLLLLSRPLIDVTTFSLEMMMSRPAVHLHIDVATAYDSVLISRLYPDVVTSCLILLQFLVA